jgi:subtilisin family serine protease
MNGLWFRFVIALVLVAMLVNPAAPTNPAHAQESDYYVPDEIVVKLLYSADLAGIALDYALDPTPLSQFGARPIYRLRILDSAAPPDRAAALAADPRVVYAEPNFLGGTPEGLQQVSWAKGGDGEDYADQWAVGIMRLPEAHTVTRGAGVTVAVLDTGVDFGHPALAGRLVDGYDFVDLDADPSEEGVPGQDAVYGHGTHVAGLIALAAPEANILPVRVLDPDGHGHIWVIAEALAYAIDPDGDPNTADGAAVINLSLGTTRPTHLLAEIVAAVTCEEDDDPGEDDDCLTDPGQHGAVVVAAAGNSGSSTPEYPAAEGIAGSLAVGASTSADTLASFSNYGSWVHIAAPGEGILSSIPGGEYGVWSGTSMAAPLAAGEAALLRAADPSLTATALADQIVSKSVDIGDPVKYRIDAAAALGIPVPGELRCTGALGFVTADNLLVPQGHTCTLTGGRVKGSVKVEAGSTLHARGLNVYGGLDAKGALSINLSDSIVRGSVKVEEGRSASLAASSIYGNAEFVKNSGDLFISNNTIDGNLLCKENSRMPTGGGNNVQGNKEEQCSGL